VCVICILTIYLFGANHVNGIIGVDSLVSGILLPQRCCGTRAARARNSQPRYGYPPRKTTLKPMEQRMKRLLLAAAIAASVASAASAADLKNDGLF